MVQAIANASGRETHGNLMMEAYPAPGRPNIAALSVHYPPQSICKILHISENGRSIAEFGQAP
jgi:hypothetical protein